MHAGRNLWGSEALPFTVRTKHGPARVEAHHFNGHQILILARPYSFQLVDQQGTVTLPEGVAFVQNKELERRTNRRVRHQIVTDGIYDLFRSLAHVVRGEKEDAREIHEMRQLTFDFIGVMRGWRVLDEHEKDVALRIFGALGDELASPKRNPKKLTASERLKKAGSLKTSKGNPAPMPTAFTASAGALHLSHRSKEAHDIAAFFTPRRMKLWSAIERLHAVQDDVWRFFQERSRPLSSIHALRLAAERPNGATKRVAREELEKYDGMLAEIRVRPYIDLIDRMRKAMCALGEAIDRFVPSTERPMLDLKPHLKDVRAPLHLMRLIRFTEMELVMPIAFLEHRWKKWDAARRGEVLSVFTSRLALQASRGVGDDAHGDVPPETLEHATAVLRAVDSIVFSSEDTKDARKAVRTAKKALKELVRDLSR